MRDETHPWKSVICLSPPPKCCNGKYTHPHSLPVEASQGWCQDIAGLETPGSSPLPHSVCLQFPVYSLYSVCSSRKTRGIFTLIPVLLHLKQWQYSACINFPFQWADSRLVPLSYMTFPGTRWHGINHLWTCPCRGERLFVPVWLLTLRYTSH